MLTTATTNLNGRQAVSSRSQRCPNVDRTWLETAEMRVSVVMGAAGIYFTGIKHPAWRPPEEPM